MSYPITVALIHPSRCERCDNCGTNASAAYRVVWDGIGYNYCEPCQKVSNPDETDMSLVQDMTDLLDNLDIPFMSGVQDMLDKIRIRREEDEAWSMR
jgi:hypothetical protein